MKYFAIGDIHGRNDLLQDLLSQKRERYPDHTLVFLGDMVDRGPDSFYVVDTIKRETEKGAIALLGNHEDMMLTFYRLKIPDKQNIWMRNGGMRTIDSYGEAMKIYGFGRFFETFGKSGHAQWMRDLPLHYETDEVWFSHAPIAAEEHRHFPMKEDFRICRYSRIWSCHHDTLQSEAAFARNHGKLAVCGHVHAVFERIFTPREYRHIVYTDTGAGCSKEAPLTGSVIEDGKMVGFLQAFPPKGR